MQKFADLGEFKNSRWVVYSNMKIKNFKYGKFNP